MMFFFFKILNIREIGLWDLFWKSLCGVDGIEFLENLS